VGRHHYWAAGPLGLVLSLYIVTPFLCNRTITVHYSTWYQIRVSFLSTPQHQPSLLLPEPPPPPGGSSLPGRHLHLARRGPHGRCLPRSRPPASATPSAQHILPYASAPRVPHSRFLAVTATLRCPAEPGRRARWTSSGSLRPRRGSRSPWSDSATSVSSWRARWWRRGTRSWRTHGPTTPLRQLRALLPGRARPVRMPPRSCRPSPWSGRCRCTGSAATHSSSTCCP
jgi:hypothetical protein